jgi:competence protein ComEC
MRKKLIILGAVLVMLGIAGYIFKWEHRAQMFEIYFFYLERGHSVFIRTPHGETILIDGGQNSQVIRELTRVFPFYRRKIDLVIATRADPKNVGGLIDVLKRFKVGKILEPEMMGTSSALSIFEKTARKEHIPIEEVTKGDSFIRDDVQFDVFFPDPKYEYNKSNIPELHLKITYGTTTIALLGDSSTRMQKSLADELGKVYLVEFAHGATKSRVSAVLLNSIKPDVIVSTKREETKRFEFR